MARAPAGKTPLVGMTGAAMTAVAAAVPARVGADMTATVAVAVATTWRERRGVNATTHP